ncbi:MAG: hypothetical protein EBZ48_01730 [Proteobacteria bacterium]|nr:hypothetical protein [Pseudomonadota bacterium]
MHGFYPFSCAAPAPISIDQQYPTIFDAQQHEIDEIYMTALPKHRANRYTVGAREMRGCE